MKDAFEKLSERGWEVKRCREPKTLPNDVSERYTWLPSDVLSVLGRIENAFSPDETSWFNTCALIRGEVEVAFTWDEWERMSLTAAEGFPQFLLSTRVFWDNHFPFFMSVKSGYAFAAVRRDFKIVVGEELEFEETDDVVADDFTQFLNLLVDGDKRLDRWV